ncbi:glycosyltransferase family protein [Catelliglobosispora koreensis]|uniref:hypothetical protein n=1 Tax=Catelliglobosispora koreensis TaxID=129052 RepID=UPI00036EFB86|nr:hypothetical protein [Catelliglobosispora koreensis]
MTWRIGRPADWGACLAYLLLALWVAGGLLRDPQGLELSQNASDQTLVEWFLAYGSRFWDGDHSLLTDRMNAPDGINLLTNAATTGLGVLFGAVTMLFGAPVTFAVLMVLNLAATAFAWYLLFHRVLHASPIAAGLGGGFCGFAPGMVSQANSHLHMTAQWLVPAMIWCVVALFRACGEEGARVSRILRPAVAFGLLVVAQVFIGEEVLFLTAASLAVFTIIYALAARPPWHQVWRFAAGIAIAVGIAVPLLTYPLWLQFAGPQSVPNGVFNPDYFSADLASFPAYSPLSLAGDVSNASLSTGPAEYNTFYGAPLILLVLWLVFWLRRSPVAWASVITALAMSALSLGAKLVVDRERTEVELPYGWLKDIPVIDGALPMRFALAAIPLIALLIVLGWDKAMEEVGPAHWVLPLAIGVALVPLAPTSLPVRERAPVPVFYAEGHWKRCAETGDVIVPVPIATPSLPGPMRYATASRAAFGMPEGFFIGPYGRDGRATVGTWKRPTSHLLDEVAKSGVPAPVGDKERIQAGMDFAAWKARCVVLTSHPHRTALQTVLEDMLGPGEQIADALVWKIGEPRTSQG